MRRLRFFAALLDAHQILGPFSRGFRFNVTRPNRSGSPNQLLEVLYIGDRHRNAFAKLPNGQRKSKGVGSKLIGVTHAVSIDGGAAE